LDTTVDSFLAKVDELQRQHMVFLANGSADNFAAYQKICGILEGIALCEREFKEITSAVSGDESIFEDLEQAG
jgi:hypothetical protein